MYNTYTSFRRIAVLPGDPAGIGYEITAKALCDAQTWECLLEASLVTVVYADAALFKMAAERFAPTLALTQIEDVSQADDVRQTYLIDVGHVEQFEPGKQSASCALVAFSAITRAVEDAKRDLIAGICTGPIHKVAMRLANVGGIGHTEMLAQGFGVTNPTTLFLTRDLRIFFYSRHLSLRQAIDALDVDKLVSFCRTAHRQMAQLGFSSPRLALAALNPHASDGGQFGDEEARILTPAAQKARAEGINISDPIGADSVFAQAASGQYDAVISLYHDQGHIAAKTYDFERTISATLGLPVLRTSVDHGTAFDIAWQGIAQFVSMKTALKSLAKYL